MLAGPPPRNYSNNTNLPPVQQQPQFSGTNMSNTYRPPILPPNFQGTSPVRSPLQPPIQPPPMANMMNQPPPPPPPPQYSHPYPAMVNSAYPTPMNSPQPMPSSHISSKPSYPNPAFQSQTPPNMMNNPAYDTNSYPAQPNMPPSGGTNITNTYSNLSGPPVNPINNYPNQQGMSGSGQQPFPSARLDSDLVPNVVQVLEQSQEKIIEPFVTNAPGLLPPLAGLDFTCQDQGNCNPRLMRSTIYTVPNSVDMLKQSQIPIALSISPLADLRSDELEPPLTNFGAIGPVRCHRCKAYMCPFMKFIDGGKRFVCCFCSAATDVANEYFSHLDHAGNRTDCYQRAELCLGSYEIPATKQYCKDEQWPEPPAYIFMIDVSYNSIRSGLVYHLCQMLKDDLLDFLPKEKDEDVSKFRVGFATFDKQVHFYNIKGNLGQPQMMIVSDLEDVFVPLLDGFLCPIDESRGVINTLLERIPMTFSACQESETILAPVIQCGLDAFKAANCNGKIYLFSSTLPTAAAPGKLSNRDDKKLLGTDREKILLSPVNDIYTKIGEECAQAGCSIDLYAFSNNYLDLATIGEMSRISGGEIQKFDYFSIDNDGERLYANLKRSFQRTTIFDALMRVRTSSGIRPVDFLGNFYMSNTTEMIFGSLDADKSVCVELKHDDKLSPDGQIFTQVALLYTSTSGQRRLRILNLSLTTTSSYSSLYPGCDLDTIMNYITKIAVRSVNVSSPRSIRENIIAQSASMLATYRKHCAQSTTNGQLILPDTMKLLPVYIASLIKSDVLIGSQTLSTDERSCLINRVLSMNIQSTSVYLYPRIYPLNTLDENNLPPSMVRCLYDRFLDTGAYVIDNGLVMYIWLGSRIDPQFIQNVFTHQNPTPGQPDKFRLGTFDNSTSKNVRHLLSIIRNERHSHMKFHVIQQRDQLEPFFRNYLVEDKGFSGGASYVDFLYHLHREIRSIIG